jgi:hypothetical protein
MKETNLTIAVGIGDNLAVRIFFDAVKHEYKAIRISHDKHIIDFWRNNDPLYCKFLDQLGTLLFSEPPYIFTHEQYKPIHTAGVLCNLSKKPASPNLSHLLCKGKPLDLNEEYVVITTKVRSITKSMFMKLSILFWPVLTELSKRYKIVVMGEREMELSKEYNYNRHNIFGIYEQIITNVPNDRLIDLTVPALGITVPNMDKIQQDCLIMKNAKKVITFGLGGNFWLAMAVANVLGYRDDNDITTDMVNNPTYPTAFITKNWMEFLQKIREI